MMLILMMSSRWMCHVYVHWGCSDPVWISLEKEIGLKIISLTREEKGLLRICNYPRSVHSWSYVLYRIIAWK